MPKIAAQAIKSESRRLRGILISLAIVFMILLQQVNAALN